MWLQRFWYRTLRRPLRLYVKHHGDPKKPVIVLLHGIAADSQIWSKIIPHLTPNYHCITIDLLGSGRSPKPDWLDYTMDDHTAAVIAALKRLNMPKKYILVGHSLGSLIATRIALSNQKNLSQLYLLSPPVYPALKSIKSGTARRLTGLLLAAYTFMRSEKMTPALFVKLSRIFPFPDNIIRDPAAWRPAILTLEHCIEQQTILDDARKLTVPTHVFYGLYDQVVIGSNVQLLGKNRHITIHSFMNDHRLTNHYGRVVAAALANQPLPKRRPSRQKKPKT